MRSSTRNAAANAIAGAHTAGISTLCTIPCHSTRAAPDCTSAAPMRPPISAWDDDDGRPSHHVSRFHTIAPVTAASTVRGVARLVSMIPWPTVFATAVVTNAPARFAIDAISTARRGESARVDTDVATAFAVSWNPFVKSKTSATATVMTRSVTRGALAVLDENRLEDVGGVLAGVDGLLELLVDVLPADDRQRIGAGTEQLGDRLAREAVALVL